jgi:RimJ/RimL family protein N-acetyltransferase
MNIHGKKVVLRAIEPADLPRLLEWANDPEIQYWLGGWQFPVNSEDQKNWFDSLSIKSLNQRFAIETKDLGLIGSANLVDIDWKNRHAHHGMMLGDVSNRGQGYGVDTIMAMMRYAFDELGLQRLDSTIIEYNAASIRVYLEKCGWKKEGIKRNWYYRKGRFWDSIIMGITLEDYRQFILTKNYWKELK